MTEEEEGGHHLGVRACAGAQISVLNSIMPVLYQFIACILCIIAPHIAVVLGMSSTRAGGNGLNTMLPCPANLNPKCLCLCALCNSRAALPKQLLMAHAENLGWGNHIRDFVQVYRGGGADPQWEISS